MNLSALCMCVWFLFGTCRFSPFPSQDLSFLQLKITSTGSKNLSFGAYSDTKFNSFDAGKWILKIQAFKINQEIPNSNGKKCFYILASKPLE